MRRLACLPIILALSLGCTVAVVEGVDDGPASTSTTGSTGDGDPTTGDGDPTTGDGDGDPATAGDGDGDGDGDPPTGDGDGDPPPATEFRVVVLADPHVPPPGYFTEDASLLTAKDKLIQARDKIALIDPPPDFVVVLGDLVHDTYSSSDASWYLDHPNAFNDVDAIFDGFPVPVYPVFGDSDYDVPGNNLQLSHDLFAQTFDRDPYYSVDHLGWRFVFSNSQQGATYDSAGTEFDPEAGSFGDTQLDWIRSEIDAGVPTVLFSHFPLTRVAKDENPDGTYADINEAIADVPTLEMIVSGHVHAWETLPDEFGVPHLLMGSTRFDVDNFLLFEFQVDTDQFDILDIDKVNWGAQTAATWTYEGTPAPAG